MDAAFILSMAAGDLAVTLPTRTGKGLTSKPSKRVLVGAGGAFPHVDAKRECQPRMTMNGKRIWVGAKEDDKSIIDYVRNLQKEKQKLLIRADETVSETEDAFIPDMIAAWEDRRRWNCERTQATQKC